MLLNFVFIRFQLIARCARLTEAKFFRRFYRRNRTDSKSFETYGFNLILMALDVGF